ncbi:hypothetical protein ACSQ67_016512 [Phaseolus vulgaris]
MVMLVKCGYPNLMLLYLFKQLQYWIISRDGNHIRKCIIPNKVVRCVVSRDFGEGTTMSIEGNVDMPCECKRGITTLRSKTEVIFGLDKSIMACWYGLLLCVNVLVTVDLDWIMIKRIDTAAEPIFKIEGSTSPSQRRLYEVKLSLANKGSMQNCDDDDVVAEIGDSIN